MNKKGNGEVIASISMLALLLGFILCIMGFDYVGAGHIGVKERMGVIDETPWGPGVQWTGILTSTVEFSTRIQLREYEASAASKDMQMVETEIALNFRIDPNSAPEIYRTIGKDYQDIIIAPIVQESVKSGTAKYNAESLVNDRPAVKEEITQYIKSKLQDKGLIVTEVSITDFEFSDEFKQAIEKKQVAEQDALTAENRLREMEFTSKAMKLQTEVLEIKKLDIELARIEVDKIKAEKWDGVMPTTIVYGGNEQELLLGLNTEIRNE